MAGAATGAVYVLSFNTLRALVIIKFRAKREKIFQKSTAFFISKNFFIYLSEEFNLAVFEEGIISYTHQTKLL